VRLIKRVKKAKHKLRDFQEAHQKETSLGPVKYVFMCYFQPQYKNYFMGCLYLIKQFSLSVNRNELA